MSPITPLDIVRRTPKNNCGKCGHPTCMAFAVEVATRGADPGRCPFIDLQGLPAPALEANAAGDPARQRELALIEHLKAKIAALDFADLAGPLGAAFDRSRPDCLAFSFLGQEVLCCKTGLQIDEEEPEDPRDMILLYNYVASGGGLQPAANWIGLESLPNSISKVKTLALYAEDRLAELFSHMDRDRILDLGARLAAVDKPDSAASLGLVIPVLPMVPQYILYWEAEPEDGFAARVKILFDRYVLDFLDLESLVFSAERLADRLAGLARGANDNK